MYVSAALWRPQRRIPWVQMAGLKKNSWFFSTWGLLAALVSYLVAVPGRVRELVVPVDDAFENLPEVVPPNAANATPQAPVPRVGPVFGQGCAQSTGPVDPGVAA